MLHNGGGGVYCRGGSVGDGGYYIGGSWGGGGHYRSVFGGGVGSKEVVSLLVEDITEVVGVVV
jgi:hypothetical protein